MSDSRNRQRIRREEVRFQGKNRKVEIRTEEHSVFLPNGNIISRVYKEVPEIQGSIPHNETDIAGVCGSCSEFTTRIIACELCSQLSCALCSSTRNNPSNGTTIVVCPACARYLQRYRWLLILKKIFIGPFAEQVGR